MIVSGPRDPAWQAIGGGVLEDLGGGWLRAHAPGALLATPFFGGTAGRLTMRLRPEGGALSIETQNPTRFNKARLELDAAGAITFRGEELREATATPRGDGTFDLVVEFAPFRTRLDFLSFHVTGGTVALHGVEWQCWDLDVPQPSAAHAAAMGEDGAYTCVHEWSVFRDYIHLEFEILRPGALPSSLSIESEVPLAHAAWFTHDLMGEWRAPPEGANLHPLGPPGRSRFPVPSPALMDIYGPSRGWAGHLVRAVTAEPVQMGQIPLEESEKLARIQIHARFDDGHTVVVRPLWSVVRTAFWVPLVERHLARAVAQHGPGQDFIEIGGRGPGAEAVRRRVEGQWRYLGVDIEPGPNVDLVADVHALSDILPHGQAGAIYSNSVLEHLFSPERVIAEANRLLRDDGLFIGILPCMWPLHQEPWDFQRWTIHKFHAVLNGHTGFEVLETFEINEFHLVPKLPYLPGINRGQDARAPGMVGVVARKTGPGDAGWTGWAPGLAKGRYEA